MGEPSAEENKDVAHVLSEPRGRRAADRLFEFGDAAGDVAARLELEVVFKPEELVT